MVIATVTVRGADKITCSHNSIALDLQAGDRKHPVPWQPRRSFLAKPVRLSSNEVSHGTKTSQAMT